MEQEILNAWENKYLSPDDDEPEVIFECEVCEEPIYEGDDYYFVFEDVRVCESCMEKFRRTAWRSDD